MSDSQMATSIGQAVFSAAFAPRVLEIRFGEYGDRLEAHLMHFDRLEGRFREATAGVWLDGGQVGRIDPPLMTPREFQQALKRFYAERFSGVGSAVPSAPGEVPRQVLDGLLKGVEGHLAQREEDGHGTENLLVRVSDRRAEQQALQESERLYHDLVILGRYHRRRGDFVGGVIEEASDAAFGFTTGSHVGDIYGDPNEDALGFDRVGGLEVFVVADAHHGARSSELAVCKLLELLRLGFEDEDEVEDEAIQRFLIHAVARCHATIVRDLKSDKSMTSLVAAIRKGSSLCWASVSDSFLFRVKAGQVGRINRDRGYGIAGRNLSVWLGDKLFHKKFIDFGLETMSDQSFFLATDGVLKHPQHRVRSLIDRLASEADLNAVAHGISRDYAVSGQDNAAFIILRGPQESR